MRASTLIALFLSTYASAVPNKQPEKRQADLSQLLELASEAGITALPTDPALLLSLGPIAAFLASELPTAPVLSVLETAAPSGFLSEILHNPAYASSFESAFAAGTPPGWFQSLPTDVKSYLHTYSDYGGVATAAAEAGGLLSAASASGSGGSSGTASTGSTGSGTVLSSAGSGTGGGSMTITSAPSTTGPASGVGVSAGPPPSTTTGGSASAGGASSSVSKALAPRETGLLALGIAGVVGVVGLAVAL